MQIKKARHIFVFFLLFDAVLLIISIAFKQKTNSFKLLSVKIRSIRKKGELETEVYTLNRTERFKSTQPQPQLVANAVAINSTTATNYKNRVCYDWHQPRQASNRLPKLMLYPFHTFW